MLLGNGDGIFHKLQKMNFLRMVVLLALQRQALMDSKIDILDTVSILLGNGNGTLFK